jgi:hypothetical protein
VHAWVGQILLNCDVFKRQFVRSTLRRESSITRCRLAPGGVGRPAADLVLRFSCLKKAHGAHPPVHALKHSFSSGGCAYVQRGKWHRAEHRRCPTRCANPVWRGPSATRPSGGVPPPPTIMAIASALPRLLTATAAPAMTWLPLNVVIVDNDRGDSPSSYRARAFRAGAQEVSRDTT